MTTDNTLAGDAFMTPVRYQQLFAKYLQGWAMLHNYNIYDNLPEKVLRELADAACEQIRREYRLSNLAHRDYKAHVLRAMDALRRGKPNAS